MKFFKQSFIVAVCLLALSSCHGSKYMKKVHKELKGTLVEAKVRKSPDTIRVIYGELGTFDFNKDELKSEVKPSFTRFAEILKRYDRVSFIINGYTDNVGTNEVNQSLSDKRATNTKMFFETNGVASGRMATNGMGAASPIMPNNTDEGRQANRRVEFLLYDTQPKKKK